MKFALTNNKSKDKTTIIFNKHIILSNIPKAAYQWQIGYKSAVEHVMNGYKVGKAKGTNIINNANDFAIETMKDEKKHLKTVVESDIYFVWNRKVKGSTIKLWWNRMSISKVKRLFFNYFRSFLFNRKLDLTQEFTRL